MNSSATITSPEQEEQQAYYEALDFDGLERRENYRLIAYREDILHIFEKRDAAATIFEIIFRWQDYRKKELLIEIGRRKKKSLPALTQEEVAEKMWIYMSYNDFVRESGGAISYNTVIRTLDYLVNEVHAFDQRENHNPDYPDFEYCINKEVMRKRIKDLPRSPQFRAKVPKKKKGSTQMGTGGSTQKGTSEVYPKGYRGLPKWVQGSTQMGVHHILLHITHKRGAQEEKIRLKKQCQKKAPPPPLFLMNEKRRREKR